MLHKNKWSFLVIAALVVAAGVGGALAAGAVKARPTSVAVADIQKIFDSLSEKVQTEADLQAQADKFKQEQMDREKDLKQLQSDLEILASGTPAFKQKSEEGEKKAFEYQAWRSFAQSRIGRERAIRIEDIYRKVIDSTGRLAKESGYDVVLFKEGTFRFPADKPEQISGIIQMRKVLWAADDLDITDQVIQKMNNEFKNAAAPAAAK